MTLEIKDLKVNIEDKEILKGVNLVAEKGKVTVLMGRNGSGKSTLANAVMGHPSYNIISGKLLFNNEEVQDMKPNERAKKGLFLSFQYPQEVAGVPIKNFLRTAYNIIKDNKLNIIEFRKLLNEKLKLLDMKEDFINRSVNEGFSGGEKKRSEILQLAVLQPKFAILDETDSGLDVEALKIVAEGVNKIRETSNMGILLITHYNRILKYINADKVLIMTDGKITKEGPQSLADDIENNGYADLQTIKIEW